MFQADHIVHFIQTSPSPSVAALRIIGEVRCELDQMASLLEAAMTEGESARTLDSPERRRGQNIGRALGDIIRADSRRLGDVELRLAPPFERAPL